jgi:hypothetical protein
MNSRNFQGLIMTIINLEILSGRTYAGENSIKNDSVIGEFQFCIGIGEGVIFFAALNGDKNEKQQKKNYLMSEASKSGCL